MALTIDYQNLRGLRTRSMTFCSNVLNVSADVVGVTETWLNDSFFDAEFTDGRFNVFRRDRMYNDTYTTRGGGCLMLVKKEILAVRMTELESNINFVEDIWVQFQLPDGLLYLSLVYITSKSDNTSLTIEYLNHLEQIIANLNCNDKILIMGDFNIRNIDWIKNPNGNLMAHNITGDKAFKLINTLNVCGLNQHNSVLNCDMKTLDLVLSTQDMNAVSIFSSQSSLVPIDKYHPPITIKINLSVEYLTEIEHRKLNFRKADYALISETLRIMNWDFITTPPIDSAVFQFYVVINDIIRNFVPPYKKKRRHPFWFSMELIKLLKKKEKARLKWTKNERQIDYISYSELRAKCKVKVTECHKHYIDYIQSNIKNNIKLFWAYSKNKRKTNSYPSTIHYQDVTANTPKDISEAFSSYFQTTFTDSPNRSNSNTLLDVRPNIVKPIITIDCVVNILSKLNENKNGGPDGIPSLFWKRLKEVLACPLTLIFNKSLDEGMFPGVFKKGFVTPIFKSGDQFQAINYRPVCLLNIIALVFEKCVLM